MEPSLGPQWEVLALQALSLAKRPLMEHSIRSSMQVLLDLQDMRFWLLIPPAELFHTAIMLIDHFHASQDISIESG